MKKGMIKAMNAHKDHLEGMLKELKYKAANFDPILH